MDYLHDLDYLTNKPDLCICKWVTSTRLSYFDGPKFVDGRCQIQIPVTLVDQAVWSFPWFSPKQA